MSRVKTIKGDVLTYKHPYKIYFIYPWHHPQTKPSCNLLLGNKIFLCYIVYDGARKTFNILLSQKEVVYNVYFFILFMPSRPSNHIFIIQKTVIIFA